MKVGTDSVLLGAWCKVTHVNKVLDIGAGTGSYTQVLAEHGYRVIAVEPSITMRQQAIAHPSVH